jgi:hypothetical protein
MDVRISRLTWDIPEQRRTLIHAQLITPEILDQHEMPQEDLVYELDNEKELGLKLLDNMFGVENVLEKESFKNSDESNVRINSDLKSLVTEGHSNTFSSLFSQFTGMESEKLEETELESKQVV